MSHHFTLKTAAVLFMLSSLVSSYATLCNVAGTVSDIRGNPLVNVSVTAWMNSTFRGNATSYAVNGTSRFLLDVQGDTSEIGDAINFTIDGVAALEGTVFLNLQGYQNLSLTQAQVSHEVVVNEFKTGSGGWVELYNNGSHSANIVGWTLKSNLSQNESSHAVPLKVGWNLVSLVLSDSGSYTFSVLEDTLVHSGWFTLFAANESGLVLSESLGGLSLEDPYAVFKDGVSYDSRAFNASWAVFPPNVSVGRSVDGSGGWTVFDFPSPGSSN